MPFRGLQLLFYLNSLSDPIIARCITTVTVRVFSSTCITTRLQAFYSNFAAYSSESMSVENPISPPQLLCVWLIFFTFFSSAPMLLMVRSFSLSERDTVDPSSTISYKLKRYTLLGCISTVLPQEKGLLLNLNRYIFCLN